MSDVNLKDKEDEDEEAGFDTLGEDPKDKKPVQTETSDAKTKTPEELKAEADAAKLKADADEVARKKAEDEAPVTLTKKQLDEIMRELEESRSTKKAVQSLSGTVGNLSTGVADLKKTTAVLEITDADFADLEKEFPKIGEGVKKGLGSLLKRMTGRAPPPGVGEQALKTAIFQAHEAEQNELLEDEFGTDDQGQPIWKTILGKPDAADPSPYRKWFAKQPEAFRNRVGNSYSALVLIRAINKFQSEERAAAKAEADRKAAETAAANQRTNGADRRRAAVTPRGDGGTPPPPKGEQTEDDGFDSVEVKKVV